MRSQVHRLRIGKVGPQFSPSFVAWVFVQVVVGVLTYKLSGGFWFIGFQIIGAIVFMVIASRESKAYIAAEELEITACGVKE